MLRHRFTFCFIFIYINGCGAISGLVLPNEILDPVDPEQFQLVTRFVHISDAQIVDEESPARLTSLALLSASAWRPQEAYAIHLLDGMIRTVNKIHEAQDPIDFVIHTGDAVDNSQQNELQWFIQAFDGGMINPRTGPDDREPAMIPDPLLDPHHPFMAQGLYRNGMHGNKPTIEWYSVFGNHDRFAIGVFPILVDLLDRRISPLPLDFQLGIFFPIELNPIGQFSLSPISPANPGPPPLLNFPRLIQANPDRKFFSSKEFIEAHLQSLSPPIGHGFDPDRPAQTWYSVSPEPGLRLITLNSASPLMETPTHIYSEGAISPPQLFFLNRELEKAQALGESVIVATHHPIGSLEPVLGTSLTAFSFQQLLNRFSCVKLHIAGHWHQNVVIDRGSYLEIVTGSIIDTPQQGRVIELWKRNSINQTGDNFRVRYRMFSHLDEISPPDTTLPNVFDDPFIPLRRIAADLADSVNH